MFSVTDSLREGAIDLLASARGRKFGTILADPPWQFQNRTGKVAPEHKRLNRYGTMALDEICALPVDDIAADPSHLYLWVPNALLPDGLKVMDAWGYRYISNIIWHKVRKDGGSDGRGVGFYFRNVTEILLFGVKGKNARTLDPGRSQVNMIATRKREHSRKPDEQYKIIEDCSWGPRLEMFSRGTRRGWTVWGNQADDDYKPTCGNARQLERSVGLVRPPAEREGEQRCRSGRGRRRGYVQSRRCRGGVKVRFDPQKQAINVRKHGLTFDAAPLLFEGAFIEEVDKRADYGETRFVATGPVAEFGGRICVVVYMWRDSERRVISFRKANDKEARRYRDAKR